MSHKNHYLLSNKLHISTFYILSILFIVLFFFSVGLLNASADEVYFNKIEFTASDEWILPNKIFINEDIVGKSYSVAFQWWPLGMSEQVQISNKYSRRDVRNGDFSFLPTTINDTLYKVKVIVYPTNASQIISPYSLVFLPPDSNSIATQIETYLKQQTNFQVDTNGNTLLFSTDPIDVDSFGNDHNVELYGRVVFWSKYNPFNVVYTPYNLLTTNEYQDYNELSTTWVVDTPDWAKEGEFLTKMYIKWKINNTPFYGATSRIKTQLTFADQESNIASDGITVLAMGQSNMLGSRKAITGDKTKNSKVFIQNRITQEWEVADLSNIEHFPLRAQYNSNNLAFHFSKRLQEETGKDVYLVMSARGGHSIRYWSIWEGASPGYQFFLKEAHDSNIENIDILLWLQGESDNLMSEANYTFEFDRLLGRIQSSPFWKKPFVTIVWELAETQLGLYGQNTFFRTLNSDVRPWTTVSPTANLPTVDGLHFSGESLVEIGYNYFWDSFIGLLETCESNPLPQSLLDISQTQGCVNN